MDYRGLLRLVSPATRRTAGPVSKTVRPLPGPNGPVFIWRINDHHGPRADSLYCRIIGLRSLRSVHHALVAMTPTSAFYSPVPPRSRRQRYLRWVGRHPYL